MVMNDGWTTDISNLYRKLARIAVPARVEQVAALLTLIPFGTDESFRVVELASGEGLLSQAILEAFPGTTLLALDYEKSMRDATEARLQQYGKRVEVQAFDILRDDWFNRLDGIDVVVSSLCIHHLDAAGKQRLFKGVRRRLSEHGALLIADLIAPKTSQANTLFAATWDAMAEAASIEQTLSRELFELFEQEHWNLFRYPDPDFDKPSPLFEQLTWLREAGFPAVDCFWMQAGHAIYGGYRNVGENGVSFDMALEISRRILT